MARPRKIKSVKQFENKAESYFNECEAKDEPITLTGLIRAVGLACRDSLDEYGRREEFSYSVKRAKLRCEHEYEKALHGPHPTGAIFALKNFGWSDRQDVEITQQGPVIFKWQD